MNDRIPIKDRTLVLRVLVPGLEARLRDKMLETEEDCEKESYLDLNGVTCEPTVAHNHTLWSFHCDGATYPAKLVNLPCPVELHKTHDHAAYYKSVDIAQMLIVYEDDMALEEADEKSEEGFPSYYHSGLTAPMTRVVERRFASRDHKAAAPPRAAVIDVEADMIKLMDKVALNEKSGSSSSVKRKVPALTSANKVLVEVEEEIVEYEPWMEENGVGVEFEADDQICDRHPEVWLSPDTLQKIRDDEEEAIRKKQEAAMKKEAKKQSKKEKKAEMAAVRLQADNDEDEQVAAVSTVRNISLRFLRVCLVGCSNIGTGARGRSRSRCRFFSRFRDGG